MDGTLPFRSFAKPLISGDTALETCQMTLNKRTQKLKTAENLNI